MQLHGVTLIAAACAQAATMDTTAQNCSSFQAPTDQSLIPTIQHHARQISQVPLVLFLTQNVSLGSLYAVVNRPVFFIGLVTRTTSVDFLMNVNQLNLTGTETATATFISVVLENLAGGDVTSGELAAPYSLLIVANLWPLYVRR